MSEYPTYLIHYGIQGQKWGVRRFQNEDGSYTSEGLERRRQLEQNGASRKELRRVDKVAKREVRYNKNLAKQQNFINKRFDKVTERIKTDKQAGLNPREKDIQKAIRLGTEFRKRDYIAKNPNFYYDQADKVMKFAKTSGFIAGFVGGVYGIPVAMGMTLIRSKVADKRINKAYEKAFEKARNETIADLKKHKILK